MSNQAILRVTRELGDIQRNPHNLSLSVAFRDNDVRHVRALIIGPPETPYEFGFFEFKLKFPSDYPTRAPKVDAITTNRGRTRFNPNIYASGKVCLSILGTWRGERGEEWSSAQGLESILISIQSLMSSNPYENEPGFENADSKEDRRAQERYRQKIHHETLRISVIQRMEEYLKVPDSRTAANAAKSYPELLALALQEGENGDDEYFAISAGDCGNERWEPFADLCKRRFLWYYDSYIASITIAEKKVKVNEVFETMPFEHASNSMDGKFNYPELRRRLVAIREAIGRETCTWATEGLAAQKKELTVAANLLRQFEQTVECYRSSDSSVGLDLDLENKSNPFVWSLVLFGRPMTNLDGGLFRLRISFSTRFPEEQPRVKVETDLFHHRVSTSGVLCYFPAKPDEVRSHVAAMIAAIEEESPAYDPRTTVNPEAARLFWGSAEDRKMYNRRLRRCVQRSVE